MPPSTSNRSGLEGKSRAVPPYRLRLYVTGTTPASLRAIQNLKTVCDECLPEGYELEVIDVYQQPDLTREDQIVAVPTLVKRAPLPRRLLVGDLSDRGRVLRALNLAPGAI